MCGGLVIGGSRTEVETRVEAAVTTHGPDVLAYLQRRAGDDAPDLFSETLAVVWRRRRSVPTDDEGARRWFFGVARTVLMGAARDAARRARLDSRLRVFFSPPPDHSTDEQLDVRSAVAALSPDDAELVRLVHWEGFSLADAALIVGLNASTARGRYQRAREALAVALSSADRVP